jgi:hypothetical protein
VEQGIRTFGAVLAALEDELDWELLGRTYCTGDGSTFFDEELRARVLEVGLRFADDLGARLRRGAPGRSLYLGAAVAELAPILAEHLVLDRTVHWLNVDDVELRELARALGRVGARLGLVLPLPRADPVSSVEPASCDHLWLVSVLTDPDAFPALHDALYGRAGTDQATGRGALDLERERARDLARDFLRRGARNCAVSTTDEELLILRPVAAELGLAFDVPEVSRVSAIVGDRVRLARLRGP